MVGRGRIYRKQRRVLIEFPHKNPTLPGIAHCPKCGWLATGFKQLRCKNPACKSRVDESVKHVYEQQSDTKKSLIEVVIPFLTASLDCATKVGSGGQSTHLFLDFQETSEDWETIEADFETGVSHHDFQLPKNLENRKTAEKKEFVNGLLDTAGFVNSGGWIPRDGVNGHGRMRLYFQVVRNWSLVVEVDNFLRSEFEVPIQTIDWGHPNIRSAGGKESSGAATSREHQIKIFPEYMQDFQFRIACKQRLFQELLDHNESCGFVQKEDWFPPRPISDSRRKPIHKSEADLRMPAPVRRHFDAFWQINLALGCKYLTALSESSVDPDVFALTGDIESREKLSTIRDRLAKIYSEREVFEEEFALQDISTSSERATPEFDTYAPLRDWLETYLRENYDKDSIAWITADQNLSNFLGGIDHEALQLVENLEDLRIRPDIVGLIPSTGELAFIESKVTNLNLREVGQLLGYCLVAQPKLAFLISTKKVDVHLDELIQSHPELVDYGLQEKIRLLYFDTNKMTQPVGL